MINKTFWRFGYQSTNYYKNFYLRLFKNIYSFGITNIKESQDFVDSMDGDKDAIIKNSFNQIDNEYL